MEILFFIVYSLLAFAYFGWGVYGFCVDHNDDMPAGSLLAFGYALSQVLFFPAYFIFSDSTIAVISLFLLATVFNIAYLYRLKCRGNKFFAGVCARVKQDIPAYIVFAVVIIFAAIPYLFSGFGNHWHTANEDVFDGLNGRNAYINNELIGDEGNLNTEIRRRDALTEVLHEQIFVRLGFNPKHDAKAFRERYVDYLGRLQYSSLAFFSVLLNSPFGMDVFLIQALLNLGLFAVGVFVFACRIFHQAPIVSGLAAILSAAGNFYLTTYFNGHEGSLMYNAVAPFLLYFMIKSIRDWTPIGPWLIIPIVLTGLILGAYLYPFPYIVVPVLVYFAFTWTVRRSRSSKHSGSLIALLSKRRIIITVLFIFIVGFFIAYVLAEPIRFSATQRFRSWGTILNHVGLLQFWGIWPSGVAYTPTWLGWLNSHIDIKTASLFLSVILSAISIYGIFCLIKQGGEFIAIWVPIAIFFFFVMRFAVYDSYYIYKYLYINAWIVITVTVIGFRHLLSRQHRRPIRLMASITLSLWIMINLAHNASAIIEITQKPFNRDSADYYQLLELPRNILEETYVSIPHQDHADLVRQILGDNGIATQTGKLHAKFVLREVGMKDVVVESIGETEWESKRFTLSKKPENDTIEFATYWGPEAGTPDTSGRSKPFRWVSDGQYANVLVDRHEPSSNVRYIYLCGESGPSIGFRTLEISIFDADKKEVGVMPVGAYNCHWLDVSSYRAPFSLTHHERGQIISAVDNRKMIYRIMHVGFSRTNLLEALPINITTSKDIVSLRPMPVKIRLGNGWYAFEEYDGKSFRWVNKNAEIFISGSNAMGSLVIDAATGPSAGKEILELSITDRQGHILEACQLRGRMKCSFPLRPDNAGAIKVSVRSDGGSHAIPSDPRLLNFRVFSLEWEARDLP